MRVYIVGIPYEVEICPILGEAMGAICHVRQKITIDEDLEHDQTIETLLHEVFHGIEYAMGMDLPDKDVERLCRGLYSVLEDPQNEFLWAALAGSDEIMGGNDDVDDLFESDEEVVEADPAGDPGGRRGRISQYLRTTPKEDHQWSRGSSGNSD